MSRAIYKYKVAPVSHSVVRVPIGAELLHVRVQHNALYIWALVEPDQKEMESKIFRIVGTGKPIEEPRELLHYWGTFFIDNGGITYHVFEMKPVRSKDDTD